MRTRDRIKTWLPKPQTLRNNRWLRWMGPALKQPVLWHFSRRGIATGVAVGIFFGLLIPVAQIPVSVGVAVLLRANLPMAAASTFVTNPVTFGPVYFGAYRLGKRVLGEPPLPERDAMEALARASSGSVSGTDKKQPLSRRLERALRHLSTVGKPLAAGLAIMATVSGLVVYFLISMVWALHVRWTRRRRQRARTSQF